MTPTTNGNGTSSKLIWWIMSGLAMLVLTLATALASDMRGTIAHQSADIETLQKAQAATAQALEDIRRDVHELVQQGKEKGR